MAFSGRMTITPDVYIQLTRSTFANTPAHQMTIWDLGNQRDSSGIVAKLPRNRFDEASPGCSLANFGSFDKKLTCSAELSTCVERSPVWATSADALAMVIATGFCLWRPSAPPG
jgi:hypothetical protein